MSPRRSLPPRPAAGGMRDATYEAMARLERQHWWFRAKRELVLDELRRAGAGAGTAVDVGCGTGAMGESLRSLGFRSVIGLDGSPIALGLARSNHGGLPLAASRATALPLRTASQACLVSLDVLEHLDDDGAALREFARVLEPGSPLLVTVPAYMWAWSEHDVVLGHRRRYTAPVLRERCVAAGFTVERCSYFHSWLVPIALLVRKTPLRALLRGRSSEEASYGRPAVNRALYALTRLERLLARVIPVPFGLSIVLVARAPARGDA